MTTELNEVYLITGGNQEDRKAMLIEAARQIERRVGHTVRQSKIYQTEAWGKTDQAAFLNQAIKVKTLLTPKELLETVLDIEQVMGRERKEKWAERLIDIDILFYNDKVIDEPNLVIPHPHLAQRNFVLIPLMEIAGDFKHPILKKTIEELYWASKDTLEVILFENE